MAGPNSNALCCELFSILNPLRLEGKITELRFRQLILSSLQCICFLSSPSANTRYLQTLRMMESKDSALTVGITWPKEEK